MEPRLSLRERKKQEARFALVLAAVELYEEKGYDATTVQDIVERSNFSRSTFFRYFGSKDDPVFWDLPERAELMGVRLANLPREEDPWTIARSLMSDAALEFTAEEASLERRCIRLWFAEPALRRRYSDIITEWERVVADALLKHWGPGKQIEARTAAHALIGVGRAAVEAQAPKRATVQAYLDRGFDLIENGILTHETAWRRSRPEARNSPEAPANGGRRKPRTSSPAGGR